MLCYIQALLICLKYYKYFVKCKYNARAQVAKSDCFAELSIIIALDRITRTACEINFIVFKKCANVLKFLCYSCLLSRLLLYKLKFETAPKIPTKIIILGGNTMVLP